MLNLICIWMLVWKLVIKLVRFPSPMSWSGWYRLCSCLGLMLSFSRRILFSVWKFMSIMRILLRIILARIPMLMFILPIIRLSLRVYSCLRIKWSRNLSRSLFFVSKIIINCSRELQFSPFCSESLLWWDWRYRSTRILLRRSTREQKYIFW